MVLTKVLAYIFAPIPNLKKSSCRDFQFFEFVAWPPPWVSVAFPIPLVAAHEGTIPYSATRNSVRSIVGGILQVWD